MPILGRLKAFLDANGVRYTVLSHPPVFTAEAVAAAEHVPPQELAKVVIVKTDGRFRMLVLPASRKVDLRKLPDRRARLATEAEFAHLFPHCEPGAMPPFGNLFGLPVHVDRTLARDEEIVLQAGTHRDAVRMKYADFVRLVEPTVDDYTIGQGDG
jgi:Ala-tRNA(Pro) deacylase